MITVVSLNSAMDRTILVNELKRGQVQRALQVNVQAGGKGLNVARAVRRLGEAVRVTGFAGGLVGSFLRSECRRLGIDDRLTDSVQETRTCYILAEENGNGATVVNEPGPTVSPDEVAAFMAAYAEALVDSAVVVLSGSLPPGAPATLYRELLERANVAGVRTILDSSGLPLQEGIAARPWAIKPNEEEFAELVGGAPSGDAELKAHCRDLSARGIAQVIVTLGGEGAFLGSSGRYFRIRPPRIQLRNPTGCGDAFVAGLAVSTVRGEPILDAVRLGTACAAGNAASLEPDIPTGDALAHYVSGVEIHEV